MAFPLAAALAVSLNLQGAAAVAQDALSSPQEEPDPVATPPSPPDPSLSPECRVPGSKLYTLAPLHRVNRALREHLSIKVLAIGSSATVGVGAASPAASYPARLEEELQKLFPDIDIEVVNRGISGEIAAGAVDRFKSMIAEVEPDLVIWQVGANDALARVDLETFADALGESVQWLRSHKIDVVLVDPQYTARLANDDHYGRIVGIIETVARRERVPLVHRFEAMRYLADRKQDPRLTDDQFRLSDLGYRCMAEHVAHAVTVGLFQAEPSPAAKDGPMPELSAPPGPPGSAK